MLFLSQSKNRKKAFCAGSRNLMLRRLIEVIDKFNVTKAEFIYSRRQMDFIMIILTKFNS